jgi:hydroxyethylthiazole kinase
MCTALIGAFCGATADRLTAAAGGILALSFAGELAAAGAGSRGSGSLRVALIDEINRLDAATIREVARAHEA